MKERFRWHNGHLPTPHPTPWHLALAATLLLLTGCFLGGGPTLGHEVELQPQGQGVVTCSEVCAQHGQCGTRSDGGVVALGHLDRPAVEGHTLLLPGDTAVTIVNRQPQTLALLTTGEQFQIPFYQVQLPDGRNGWVAGWCLAAP